jgi:outer membrane lipoprotein-sorting protein
MLACHVSFADKEIDPKSVLDSMYKNYYKLESYKDEGSITTRIKSNGKVHIDEMKFKTYYKSPNKVRFEYTYKPRLDILPTTRHIVINTEEEAMYLDENFKGNKVIKKINNASKELSDRVGITSWASEIIPICLLNKECAHFCCYDSIEYGGIEKIENNTAHVLKISYPRNRIEKVWIDEMDFYLLKIEIHKRYNGKSATSVIDYINVEKNTNIENSKFKLLAE